MQETEPPSELIDGEVVRKPMPNEDHGAITSWLIIQRGIYLRELGRGSIINEVRHQGLEGPPEFAIEVLSPDDRPGRILERVSFYMRSAVPLLWFVSD